MVMKSHPARGEGSRVGFADVVQQGGEAKFEDRRSFGHDGDRVGQDILVAMLGVLLQLQRSELREELLGQPRLHQAPQRIRDVVAHHELAELLLDPLR